MAQNPLLKRLVEQSHAKYGPENQTKAQVRREMQHNMVKVEKDRTQLFDRYTLSPVRVLAGLQSFDRDALIAHFRAKELRNIADARHASDQRSEGLARKRLVRVDKIEQAFAQVGREGLRAIVQMQHAA